MGIEFEIIKKSSPNKVRDIDIVITYLEGKTLQRTGELFGLTKERIRQIVRGRLRALLKKKNIELGNLVYFRLKEFIDLARGYRDFLINHKEK